MASTASLLLLCLALGVVQAEYGVLHVQTQTGDSQDFCIAFNPRFTRLPHDYKTEDPHGLVDLTNDSACDVTALKTRAVRGEVVAVAADSCLHSLEILLNLQLLQGHGLLIVQMANSSELVRPSVEKEELYDIVNLRVASISHYDFRSIQRLGNASSLWLYQPEVSKFEPSMVFIILLALACVVIGGLWAEKIPADEDRTTKVLWDSCCAAYYYIVSCGDRCRTLGGFIILLTYLAFLSSILVLLYFFYSFMVYVIIALFCVIGSEALCACLLPAWRKLVPWDCRLPLIKWEPQVRDVLLFLMCAALAITWAVLRHQRYAWILQDMFGVAICVYCIKDFRISNFKICCIILAIVFVYDVFFVFITPFFTKDGRSVMESVALGGEETDSAPAQTAPREQIPILFRLPPTLPNALSVCVEDTMLALGFGDVIFPGILVVHNIRFDFKVKTSGRIYFVMTCVAYVISLCLAYLAVVLMKRGQPALLYIVPVTVLMSLAVALVRKELRHFYSGEAPNGILALEEREMEETLPSENHQDKDADVK